MKPRSLLHALRGNRRLLALLALGLAVVGVEFGLRGWDTHQRLAEQLRSVRSRADVLAASANQPDWSQRARAADTRRQDLESRLWQTPSDAQAQARLRDWLTTLLRNAEAKRATVTLMAVQRADAQGGPAAPAAARSPAAAPVTPAASAASVTAGAARARASVSFDLGPQVLETVLEQIENGGQLASVDSLSASRRSRRVELVVSVPVIVHKEASP